MEPKKTPRKAASIPQRAKTTQVVLAALIAGLAGCAGGWVARGAKDGAATGATIAADSSRPSPGASAMGSSGASQPASTCDRWSAALCKAVGEQSEGCEQAKAAVNVLSDHSCEAALGEVTATAARIAQARGVCNDLMEKLCTDLGKETKTCAMVRERTAQFPASQCHELLDNYQALLDELKTTEKHNQPLTPDQVAKQAAGDGPSFGPKDAKVTIVEYSDFQCPYCSEASETVRKIRARYGKVVHFVFRQYPLPFHKKARPAAEAALAANAQGKFWEYHDLLFANQAALERENLEEYAKKVGIDPKKLGKALDDGTYGPEVEKDMALGQELGVEGTPSMIVGPSRVEDPRDYEAIVALIDTQLTAAGVPVPAAP